MYNTNLFYIQKSSKIVDLFLEAFWVEKDRLQIFFVSKSSGFQFSNVFFFFLFFFFFSNRWFDILWLVHNKTRFNKLIFIERCGGEKIILEPVKLLAI